MPHRLGELAEGVVERSPEDHEGEERDDRLDGAQHPGEQDARGDAGRTMKGIRAPIAFPQSSMRPCCSFRRLYGTKHSPVRVTGLLRPKAMRISNMRRRLSFTGASPPPAGKETFCRVTRVYWETFKTHARHSGQSSRLMHVERDPHRSRIRCKRPHHSSLLSLGKGGWPQHRLRRLITGAWRQAIPSLRASSPRGWTWRRSWARIMVAHGIRSVEEGRLFPHSLAGKGWSGSLSSRHGRGGGSCGAGGASKRAHRRVRRLRRRRHHVHLPAHRGFARARCACPALHTSSIRRRLRLDLSGPRPRDRGVLAIAHHHGRQRHCRS